MSNPPKELQSDLDRKLSDIRQGEMEIEYKQLAAQKGLPFSNLIKTTISTEALNTIDEETSRKAHLAIIIKRIKDLTVAILNPEDPQTQSALKDLTDKGYTIKILITTPSGLDLAWSRYDVGVLKNKVELGAIDLKEDSLTRLQTEISGLEDVRTRVNQVAITQALDIIVAGAIKIRSSDIHFEPEAKDAKLRYRIDGILKDVAVMDTHQYTQILNRIKVISKLKLNIHTAPQDGRFTIRESGTGIEVRVSILPSEYGETVVMRLLDPRTIHSSLEELGIRPDLLEEIKKQLARPNGAILTTGPTGSGKTTALYAFVQYLNNPEMKVVTIEDPIEYHVDGISQTQVDPPKGYDFANGLRSIVRQDPDIILVGEIRDEPTAQTAINAALTGHMVLSTLHTNDAAGTIPRLIELEVKPELISPALNLALGQRLVRKLCPHCRKEDKPNELELKALKENLDPIRERYNLPEINAKTPIFRPGKCSECHQEGYRGRVGVFEGFTSNREMEKLILTNPTISDVKDLAVAQGMVTMTQDAYMKVVQGITSLEEIARVI